MSREAKPDQSSRRGLEVLQDPALNKSTAFTAEERERYGLRGLLPPAICSQETQLNRKLPRQVDNPKVEILAC